MTPATVLNASLSPNRKEYVSASIIKQAPITISVIPVTWVGKRIALVYVQQCQHYLEYFCLPLEVYQLLTTAQPVASKGGGMECKVTGKKCKRSGGKVGKSERGKNREKKGKDWGKEGKPGKREKQIGNKWQDPGRFFHFAPPDSQIELATLLAIFVN